MRGRRGTGRAGGEEGRIDPELSGGCRRNRTSKFQPPSATPGFHFQKHFVWFGFRHKRGWLLIEGVCQMDQGLRIPLPFSFPHLGHLSPPPPQPHFLSLYP
jgi:hypothetical protein